MKGELSRIHSLFILLFIIRLLIHQMPLESLNIQWQWTWWRKRWLLQKGSEEGKARTQTLIEKNSHFQLVCFEGKEKEKCSSKSNNWSILGLVVIHIISWRIWEEIFVSQPECFQSRRNVKFLSYPGALRSLQHATYLKSEEGAPPDHFLFHPLASFN